MVLLVAAPAGGQEQDLEKRVKNLEEQLKEIQESREEEDLEKLRQAADTEAAAAPDASESLEERTYITASRSLQALNPEISVSGDFLAQAIINEEFYAAWDDRSSMPIRALDMHIQSTLDPFSFTKMAIGFAPPEEVSLAGISTIWTRPTTRCPSCSSWATTACTETAFRWAG